MRNYKQLNQAQRYQIEILKKAGKNQKEIAALMGISESTISRELKRNQGKKGYRPKQAQIIADNRKKQAIKALKMTPALILLIEARIRLDSDTHTSGIFNRPYFEYHAQICTRKSSLRCIELSAKFFNHIIRHDIR